MTPWYPFFGSLGFLNEALFGWPTREAILLALVDVLMFGVYLWAMTIVSIGVVLVPVYGEPVLLYTQNSSAMDWVFMGFGKWFVGMGLLIALVGFWAERD